MEIKSITDAKRVCEALKFINDADEETREALIVEYGGKAPYNLIFALNFSASIKVDMPEGLPADFKYDEISHPDLAYRTLFNAGIQRLSNCFVKSPLSKWKKEGVFIDMLRSLSPEEGEVLVFLKDKALTELFPNITAELIGKHFPHYLK